MLFEVYRFRSSKLISVFMLTVSISTYFIPEAKAEEIQNLRVAPEFSSGYDRALFRHWIDADSNGCDTRKEVLISEALAKPRVGARCMLSGGVWISQYDGKSYLSDSGLDIDHVVPLAEAWRSGAWAWTAQQRQDFANDLADPRALIAVTASANRSKGDKDLKTWLPQKGICSYIESWVAVKIRYTLTFDPDEFSIAQKYLNTCQITKISVNILPGYETVANRVTSTPATATPSNQNSNVSNPATLPSSVATASPVATPSPSISAGSQPNPVATSNNSGPRQCYVSGYTRKNGTRVSGYYRSC